MPRLDIIDLIVTEYFPLYSLVKALTQKKEQYTDIGFNMGYYIYIHQKQI